MTEFTPFSAAVGGLLIGAGAVLLMATTGRIAGVSGFLSRILPPYEDGNLAIRVAFVAGLMSAAPLYRLVSGNGLEVRVSDNTALLAIAGLLVGFGAVLGGGCTSGHGVCGTARLSPRSILAIGVFMATGIATVFVMRHVVGAS